MKEPETYEELIRYKRCVEFTKYYDVSKENLEKIYNFLSTTPDGTVEVNGNAVKLKQGTSVIDSFSAVCLSTLVAGVVFSNSLFNVINKVIQYSSSGGGRYRSGGSSSSSWSSGGGSSNNNNNNNNNR